MRTITHALDLNHDCLVEEQKCSDTLQPPHDGDMYLCGCGLTYEFQDLKWELKPTKEDIDASLARRKQA
jgi:hypothetical protein